MLKRTFYCNKHWQFEFSWYLYQEIVEIRRPIYPTHSLKKRCSELWRLPLLYPSLTTQVWTGNLSNPTNKLNKKHDNIKVVKQHRSMEPGSSNVLWWPAWVDDIFNQSDYCQVTLKINSGVTATQWLPYGLVFVTDRRASTAVFPRCLARPISRCWVRTDRWRRWFIWKRRLVKSNV